MKRTELKIDLDIPRRDEAISQIKERLCFLNYVNILKFDMILKVELIKKSKYSCKILVNSKLKDEKDILLLQAMLGDDWKRQAITFRDYNLDIENYNRLFTTKKYTNGKFKEAQIFDITKQILTKKNGTHKNK